jgi:hypothetical protein
MSLPHLLKTTLENVPAQRSLIFPCPPAATFPLDATPAGENFESGPRLGRRRRLPEESHPFNFRWTNFFRCWACRGFDSSAFNVVLARRS